MNGLRNKRVLCLDDDKSIHRILERIFESKSCSYKGISSAEQLKEALSDFCPHVLLLDIHLENETGAMVIQSDDIKELLVNVKIVVFSSSKKIDDYKMFKGLNIFSFYMKPINTEKILKKISAAVSTIDPFEFNADSQLTDVYIPIELHAIGENRLLVDAPTKLSFKNGFKFYRPSFSLIDKKYLRFKYFDDVYLGNGYYRNDLLISGITSGDINKILELRRKYGLSA